MCTYIFVYMRIDTYLYNIYLYICIYSYTYGVYMHEYT